ncbi:MAG: hypothetical protein ACREJC_04645, partial [Tepidisphaeraceae bacterium]
GVISPEEAAKQHVDLGRKYSSIRIMKDIEADPEQAARFLSGTGGEGYFRKLKTKESGGNALARAATSTATGPYQFTEGTWQDVSGKHPELGLTPDGRTDHYQAERAVRAFTQDNAEALKAASLPVNEKTLYLAHFLGAQGAIKFLNAPPETEAFAVAGKAAAKANRSVFYHEDGSPKTVAEVTAAQTRNFAGDAGPAPSYYDAVDPADRIRLASAAEGETARRYKETQEVTDLQQFEMRTALLNDMAQTEQTGISADLDPMAVADVLGPARAAEWLQERQKATDTYKAVSPLETLPEAEIDGYVASFAPKGENFAQKQEVYEKVASAAKQMRTARAQDPITHAKAAGITVGELGRAGAFAQRRLLGNAIAEKWNVPVKYFTDRERADLAATLERGEINSRMDLIQSIQQGFGYEDAPLALAEIGDSGSDVTAHIAGLSLVSGPDVARLAFRGQDAIAAKAVAPPTNDEIEGTVDTELGTALPSYLARERGQVLETAKAIYAARTIDKGLTTFDAAEFTQALQLATGRRPDGRGGIGTYNERKLILPTSLNDGEFAEVMEALSGPALVRHSFGGGAPVHVDLAGNRVPATHEDVKEGFLVPVGPGRYRVSVTDPTESVPQFLLDEKTGRHFVLDLNVTSDMRKISQAEPEGLQPKAVTMAARMRPFRNIKLDLSREKASTNIEDRRSWPDPTRMTTATKTEPPRTTTLTKTE